MSATAPSPRSSPPPILSPATVSRTVVVARFQAAHFADKQKFYFGQKEIFVPAYKSMAKAFNMHLDATVMVTFASLRSVYETVMEALDFPQLRVIAVIAEGVPENQTRRILQVFADAKTATCSRRCSLVESERERNRHHRAGDGRRHQAGLLQDWQHGRNVSVDILLLAYKRLRLQDGQYSRLQVVSTRQVGGDAASPL